MDIRDKDLIVQILVEINFIMKTVQNITEETFLADEVLQHAIVMALLNIGELARRVSDEAKRAYGDVAWTEIVGLRNFAAHGYGALRMRDIWRAVVEDVPRLAGRLSVE